MQIGNLCDVFHTIWLAALTALLTNYYSLLQKMAGITLPDDGGIALIGGGSLQYTIAIHLIELGFKLAIIYAPRHYNHDHASTLIKLGATVFVSHDINLDREILALLSNYNKICLCFGPAWIFGEDILQVYGGRIFIFNGIPLPDYLGGAHYTWQILNGSRLGCCYVQQITSVIDRGPVISFQRHTLPSDITTPSGYQGYNERIHADFLYQFIDKHLVQHIPIVPSDNQPDWGSLTYFPRLLTQECAWVDWSWTASEIEAFCNAFDDPYQGATRSQLNGDTVILKEVKLDSSRSLHPFCAGLILRVSPDSLFVAVRGGILQVNLFYIEVDGARLSFSPRLGDRLCTPDQFLQAAKKRISFSALGVQE